MDQSAAGVVRATSILSRMASRGAAPWGRPWGECLRLAQLALMLLQQGDTSRTREMLEEVLALAQRGSTRRWPAALPVAGIERAIAAPPGLFSGARTSEADTAGASAKSDTQCHRIRIRGLGGFELHIDGVPMVGGLKPQRRPLELLKALVAAGAPIGACELADTLWPDSDGDTARNCLQVAIHRLRRLLSCEHAVIVKDRKVHLNRAVCWVDAWAFANEVDSLARVGIGDPAFPAQAARLLPLYQGHLFAHDPEQPWMLAARERLRRSWLALVRRLGEHYEAHGHWLRACELYEGTLQLDPLAEAMYRRLMVCQQTIGERAEALHTYRRCRDQLAGVLGVAPSAETEQLCRSLRGVA